jgi:hypothetical protein
MTKRSRAAFATIVATFVLSSALRGQETDSQPASRVQPKETPKTGHTILEEARLHALTAYDDALTALREVMETGEDVPTVVEAYKDLIEESDRLIERIETPEFEARQSERYMLSTRERALWGASKDSIRYAFADGELRIEGTKEKTTGICSLLPPRGTLWHDLVINLEFTIVKDGFQLFLRWEQGLKSYMLNFSPAEGYALNRPYFMTIRVKGSTITLKAPDQPENRGQAEPSTSRTGGIAFGLNNGASIVVSRCSVRLLRTSEDLPMSREARLRAVAARAKMHKEAHDVLVQLQKDAEDPEKAELVMVGLDDATKKYGFIGDKYRAALTDLVETVRFSTVNKIVVLARELEAVGQTAKALAKYDQAIAVAMKQLQWIGPRFEKVLPLFKESISRSDKLADDVETPEYEAAIVERDMLAHKERALWGGSTDSIAYVFGENNLKIEGTKEKVTGICSLLPPGDAPWHDIVLDLEFTILANGFQLFLRFERGHQGYMLQFKPTEGYEMNKPNRITIRVKGSTITLKTPDQPENRAIADLTTSRTGGIAFGMNKGASILITRCSLKVLR